MTIIGPEHIGCTIYRPLSGDRGVVENFTPGLQYPIRLSGRGTDDQSGFSQSGNLWGEWEILSWPDGRSATKEKTVSLTETINHDGSFHQVGNFSTWKWKNLKLVWAHSENPVEICKLDLTRQYVLITEPKVEITLGALDTAVDTLFSSVPLPWSTKQKVKDLLAYELYIKR